MFYPTSHHPLNLRTLAASLLLCALLVPASNLALQAAPANVASQTQINSQPELVLQLGHSGDVTSVAISPDGRTIATGGKDETVKLWDAQSRLLKRTLTGLGKQVTSVYFSKDGQNIFATDVADYPDNVGGKVVTWNVATGERLRTFKGSNFIGLTVFSPDQQVIARVQSWSDNPHAGHHPGTITLWSAQNGALLRTLSKEKLDATMLSFSRDGVYLAGAHSYGSLRIWNLRTGKLQRIATNRFYFNAMTITPDGRFVIASGTRLSAFNDEIGPTQLRVYDLASGKLVKTLSGDDYKIGSFAFSPDGKVLACMKYGSILLRDTKTFAPLRTLDTKRIDAIQIVFASDGKSIFGIGRTKTPGNEDLLSLEDRPTGIIQWDKTTGRAGRVSECSTPIEYGFDVKPLADGRSLTLLTDGNTLSVLDSKTLARRTSFTGKSARGGIYALTADVRTIIYGEAVGFNSNSWKIWRSAKSTANASYHLDRTITDAYGSLSSNGDIFSHDGRLLVAVHHSDVAGSGGVLIWNLNSYKRHTVQLSESNAVYSVAFSPDDSLLALGTSAGSVDLWNTKTGELTARFLDHEGDVNQVQFSPDGKTIICADGAGIIRQWDVERQIVVRSWPAHNGYLLSLSYSADGERIVSSGRDGFTKVWDTKSGEVIRSIQSSSPNLKALLLNDAKTLVQVGTDKTLNFWDIETGDLLLTYQILPSTIQQSNSKSASKNTEPAWIAFTPNGYYDASPGAERFIHWRLDNRVLPATAYIKTKRRPDLIAQSLDTK